MQVTTSLAAAIVSDIGTFATSELIDFYTENADGKKLSKRAKRNTIEARCIELATAMLAEEKTRAIFAAAAEQEQTLLLAYAGKDEQAAQQDEQAAQQDEQAAQQDEQDEQDEQEDESVLAAEAAAEAAPEPAKAAQHAFARTAQSIGVEASWKNPVVRAKRLTQNSVYVTVDGNREGYRSIFAAFEKLGLPENKHIKFRLSVKESATRTGIFRHEGKEYLFALA